MSLLPELIDANEKIKELEARVAELEERLRWLEENQERDD